MQPFKVVDVDTMKAILNAFSELDGIRWTESGNYNLINYCSPDLTADEKLLTHWLSYITDRQMPFERIWDIGGYVLSHLVCAFSRECDGSVHEIAHRYIKPKGKSIRLECPVETPNTRLARYGITGDHAEFASRYMPEDTVLIYRTLCILDGTAGRSLAQFIGSSAERERDLAKAIRHMAAALNQLTYSVGGALSASQIEGRLEREEKSAAAFKMNRSASEGLFGRKRLWCSLRDYLKSPEFNDVFVDALAAAQVSGAERWHRSNPELKPALAALELPGDVWNNAETFRNGLFSPYLAHERRTWDMPRTIREIYDALSECGAVDFYPEQLDVTFDFVPRMCERDMCDVCLFGSGIANVCHKKAGLLCPLALCSCGYRHICDPEACRLKDNAVRGTCKSSTARAG